MAKVFVVVGFYYDFDGNFARDKNVRKVFSSKEAAETFAREFKTNDTDFCFVDVEEHDFN